ncbi:MAG: NUDIX domain-containing protein [Lachnospiraceae bacterium]|nr:NUDIX domain-containing protein [Lachnospiraceae bacterium]
MEYLDIVDQNGMPTGKTAERKVVHRDGVPHRTAHVWVLRRHEGEIQVLLQKRCMEKDSFPGCYDISSAGHIPAGMGVVDSALRELKEELNFDVKPEELVECGKKHVVITDEFRKEQYEDNQYSTIYLMWRDIPAEEIVVQKEEIESVMWMEYNAAKKAVVENTIPNCIDIEELAMLEKFF